MKIHSEYSSNPGMCLRIAIKVAMPLLLTISGISGCCMFQMSTIAAVNESEAPILVEYTHPCQAQSGWIRDFVLVKSDLIHRRESAGTPAQFHCENDQMTVELPPNYAVTIYASVLTETGCVAPDYKERKIDLIGANKTVSFSNGRKRIDAVMDKFQKLSSDLYVITYR